MEKRRSVVKDCFNWTKQGPHLFLNSHIINSPSPQGLLLKMSSGRGTQGKFINYRNCCPRLIAHRRERWGQLHSHQFTGEDTEEEEEPRPRWFLPPRGSLPPSRLDCVASLHITTSAITGENEDRSGDNLEEWETPIPFGPCNLNNGPSRTCWWPRIQPAHRCVTPRGVKVLSFIVWFISSPQLVYWNWLCSFQPNGYSAPTRSLAVPYWSADFSSLML